MTTRGTSRPIRRTSNPFMTTTASLVGLPLHRPVEFHAPEVSYVDPSTKFVEPTKGVVEYMYQTSAAMVGEGIPRGHSRFSAQMDKFTVEQEVRSNHPAVIKSIKVVAPRDTLLQPNDFNNIQSVDLKNISTARPEHPMYTTTYVKTTIKNEFLWLIIW